MSESTIAGFRLGAESPWRFGDLPLVDERASNDNPPLCRSIEFSDVAHGMSADEHQPRAKAAVLLEVVSVVREGGEETAPSVDLRVLPSIVSPIESTKRCASVINSPSRSRSWALIASLNEVTTTTSSLVETSSDF